MNERIKELAVEADNYAYKMNPEEDSYGRPANPRKFQQDRDTKFAELIVRECLLCCERTISDPVPKSVDTFEQGGIHCIDEIKQHFGVEE